jgi:quercetin dioxygenase-like cupin family protein
VERADVSESEELGLLVGAVLAAVGAATLSARAVPQDPVVLAPEMYKVVLENDRVRVIDYHLKPGQREPMHSHPRGAVVYFFTGAKMRTTLPDGKTNEGSSREGEVVWRDPVTHRAENIGDTEVHTLVVEPKSGWGK